MAQSPGGSPTGAAPSGGGSPEALFGQILQTMQAGMVQMSQDSQQRFELLERGLQQQAQALGASIEALSKRSNVVRGWKTRGPEGLPRGSQESMEELGVQVRKLVCVAVPRCGPRSAGLGQGSR